MSNLYFSFSVVFPLFCMMALGYTLRAIKLFNKSFLQQLNTLCFKVFLPLVLFISIYKSDFKANFSLKLVLFAAACVFISFAALMLIVPVFEKDNKKRSVIIQGIFRSNFILFGIPVSAALYGAENTSICAILIAFVVPLYNVLSVIALEHFSQGKASLRAAARGVATNPLIIAAVCALAFVLTKARMPVLLESTIYDISRVATPLALITLGGSFQLTSLAKYPRQLISSVIGKLIIMPVLFVTAAILFGFKGMELAALFAMLASPTAVSIYSMAQSASANDELAGQIIVTGSVLSVITIFIGITTLKSLNLI